MPHSTAKSKRDGSRKHVSSKDRTARYTVALAPNLAARVEHYSETVDTSMSKAIAALVRIGLESQETRKREFFKRLKDNLANDDPNEQDQLVEEFRDLILGH